jgi:hypothetical protein
MHPVFLYENLKAEGNLETVGVDGSITLKIILNEYHKRVLTE